MRKVKSTEFSRFIRHASESEQQRVYEKVSKGIDAQQQKIHDLYDKTFGKNKK